MNNIEKYMDKALEKRKQSGLYRMLRVSKGLVDFCSNDYLGFAASESLKEATTKLIEEAEETNIIGSTGSRLISGNYYLTENLEEKIAAFHGSKAALIFNSGYDANVGLFSSVPQRHDVICYDELVHASIRDGIRLSNAKSFSFQHNNCNDLERLLNLCKGNIFVAVESVYSMDGDSAPLNEIAKLCKKFDAQLIVDEAHATGILGDKGQGLVAELNLYDHVFARVHTFGKALGCHGAAVCGSKLLRNFLINFSRSFIYTTALPINSLYAIDAAYEHLSANSDARNQLLSNIDYFTKQANKKLPGKFIPSKSAIHSIVIGENEKTTKCSQQLQNSGFDIRAILYPTVPKGTERLRICLHAFNSKAEIENLIDVLYEIMSAPKPS